MLEFIYSDNINAPQCTWDKCCIDVEFDEDFLIKDDLISCHDYIDKVENKLLQEKITNMASYVYLEWLKLFKILLRNYNNTIIFNWSSDKGVKQ